MCPLMQITLGSFTLSFPGAQAGTRGHGADLILSPAEGSGAGGCGQPQPHSAQGEPQPLPGPQGQKHTEPSSTHQAGLREGEQTSATWAEPDTKSEFLHLQYNEVTSKAVFLKFPEEKNIYYGAYASSY